MVLNMTRLTRSRYRIVMFAVGGNTALPGDAKMITFHLWPVFRRGTQLKLINGAFLLLRSLPKSRYHFKLNLQEVLPTRMRDYGNRPEFNLRAGKNIFPCMNCL